MAGGTGRSPHEGTGTEGISRYTGRRSKTHPGRQYSTTNLKTPCLSGAMKEAEYVVSLADDDTCLSEVLIWGSSMVKSSWRSGR